MRRSGFDDCCVEDGRVIAEASSDSGNSAPCTTAGP
jgi:hypothetical protein